MIVDDYTLNKNLGKGAFGEVCQASKRGTKQVFAAKKIEKQRIKGPKARKYLDNEILILKEIDHPNIIKLYDVKETSRYIFIITEFCNGGSLSDCLDDYQDKYNKPFPEDIVQYLMKQIVSAINYLHRKTILHRDIKLDNILVNFENEEDRKKKNLLKAKIKLIDFGFARHLPREQLAYSTLGSPINMDPGILRKLNKVEHSNEYGYDEKADIWSLGTVCYELLIGKSTFDADSMKDLLNKVEAGNYTLPTTLSKEAVSFINGMLQYDFKKRLSANQLYKHKFLTKKFNQLTKIDLKQLQDRLKGSQLPINSKTNQSIWDIFGNGLCSVYLEDENNNDIINEELTRSQMERMNIDPIKIKQNNYIKDDNIPTIEKKKTKLKGKELENEFMKVFELINDNFIYIQPKLIPFIPGDDPSIISKSSDFDNNII